MRTSDFRHLALALPEALESEHMGHPDFRVGGKVFASIGPQGDWAMVKLPPELQRAFCARTPDVFEPVPGAWGARGATRVILARARRADVEPALLAAWRLTAPRKLRERFEAG